MAHEQVEDTKVIQFKSTGTIIKKLSIGTVVFHNTGMISDKMIDIMCLGIENGNFDNEGIALFNVIFRHDGFPVPDDGEKAEWMYFPDSYSAVCNVEHLIDIAIENSMDKEIEILPHIGMKCAIWRGFLSGLFHECIHAMSSLYWKGGHVPKDKLEKEEEEADEGAKSMLFALAKEYNLEMNFGEELNKYVDTKIIDALVLHADADKDTFFHKWFELQSYIMENEGTCYIPEDDCEDFFLSTFKDFLHMASGDAEDDKEWLKETIDIPVTLQTTTNVIDIANPEFQGSVSDVPNFEMDEVTNVPFDTEIPIVQGMEGVGQTVTPQQIISAAPTSVAPANVNTQAVVGANMYVPTTMDVGSFQATIKGLYLKIFSHIFQNCGFTPTGTPPFTTGDRIAENVPLTEAEKSIVKEMVCYDSQGQKMPGTKVENFISGIYIDKANTLPGFDLVLSDINGAATTRRFIPQNPNKMKQGTSELSKTAAEARQGHQYMWIINPDSTDKQFALRVHNGALESNKAGQWTAI